MPEGFNIDKDLPRRLDNLLKEGSLDKETEILKILECLSEKIKILEKKHDSAETKSNDPEISNVRLHRKWGKPCF